MSLAPRRWAAELLHVWFHELTPRDWWGGSDAIDEMLEKRFRPELEALSTCAAPSFLSDPQTALGAVLLFDQLPRNLFRGTPRAFAYDPLAQAICHGAIARGFLSHLNHRQRPFLAMPLMHSEDIADQRLSLTLFARINGGSNFPFARSHHRMIARFGRFPHRNAILGRKTSSAERRAIDAGFAW